MYLKCIRCRRVIEPTEKMVVVTTGVPATWAQDVGDRLAVAPQWHWRCAPQNIRAVAPPFIVDDGSRFRVLAVAMVAAAVICAVLFAPGGVDTFTELEAFIMGGAADEI